MQRNEDLFSPRILIGEGILVVGQEDSVCQYILKAGCKIEDGRWWCCYVTAVWRHHHFKKTKELMKCFCPTDFNKINKPNMLVYTSNPRRLRQKDCPLKAILRNLSRSYLQIIIDHVTGMGQELGKPNGIWRVRVREIACGELTHTVICFWDALNLLFLSIQ